jgi:hypothetical protein
MSASSEQRAHSGPDALTERLLIEADQGLLDCLACLAISLFGASFQLVTDGREAPRDGGVQLDQTRLTTGTSAATAVLARLTCAAAADLNVFA